MQIFFCKIVESDSFYVKQLLLRVSVVFKELVV